MITYFIYPVYTDIYWCEILFFFTKITKYYLIHPAHVMLQTLFTTCYKHYFLQNTDVHPADIISDTLQTYTLQTLFLTPCRRYTLQTLFDTPCRRYGADIIYYMLQTLFFAEYRRTPCRRYFWHPADVHAAEILVSVSCFRPPGLSPKKWDVLH